MINLDTQVLPTALCRGDIAAFFIWEPFGTRAREVCPDQAHTLGTAEGYINGYAVVSARPAWLATPQGKEIATRFLRAMVKGAEFAEKISRRSPSTMRTSSACRKRRPAPVGNQRSGIRLRRGVLQGLLQSGGMDAGHRTDEG